MDCDLTRVIPSHADGNKFASWKVWMKIYLNHILKCLGVTKLRLNTNFFKHDYVCFTTLTTLKVRDDCFWYLDSGCSMHMTGNKSLFKTLLERKVGSVTFGDGSKSFILGIGKVDIPGLPIFKDV